MHEVPAECVVVLANLFVSVVESKPCANGAVKRVSPSHALCGNKWSWTWICYFLDGCLFSDETAVYVSGRINEIIKTILVLTTIFYYKHNISLYRMLHAKCFELTVKGI